MNMSIVVTFHCLGSTIALYRLGNNARTHLVQAQLCSSVINWQLFGGADAELVNTEDYLYTLYILECLKTPCHKLHKT